MHAPELDSEPDAALQARVDELEELILQARRGQFTDTYDYDDDYDYHLKVGANEDTFVDVDDLFDIPLTAPDNITVSIIPEEVTNHLLGVFCSYIFQFSFYMSVQDFKRSVRLPPSDPDGLLPCLRDAVLLVACHFSPRLLSEYEEVFLQRTHRLLSQATVLDDKPMDFCMAAVLLSRYCFYTNRFDIGVCYTSSALSFAVGCGFHQISIQSPKPSPNMALIPPLYSEEETLRRIRLWNSIYMLDRSSSWTTGIPSSLSEEDITTPWSINSLKSGSRLQQILHSPSSPTIKSLFAVDSPTLTVQRGDTALSIRARTVALYDRCNRFVRSVSSGTVFDSAFWDTFNSIDSQLSRFLHSLPCIKTDPSTWEIDTYGEDDDSSDFDNPMEIDDILTISPPQRRPKHDSRKHTIVLAQTCSIAGILQLHSLFADRDPHHHKIMVDAANLMAKLVRFASFEPRSIHIVSAVGWAAAGQILIEELLAVKAAAQARSSAPTTSSIISSSPIMTIPLSDPSVARSNLDDILLGLWRLEALFPTTNLFIDRLREGLARL